MKKTVTIIGAGLAGSEAALTLSAHGYRIHLIDAKPKVFTDAHQSADFGELVCSNSLKSNFPDTASGLLKDELRLLGSSLIGIADSVAVAAGSALAVDRKLFSQSITERINSDPNITVVSEVAEDWNTESPVIIAGGPLILSPLSESLCRRLGGFFYFYDAAAPIVTAESLDKSRCFFSSRYGKGTADYVNCPMSREEYLAFHAELIAAKRAELKSFEGLNVFEGCMPIEVMAERGVDSLRYGPLRPVGLNHPETGEKYYAVAQLRRENAGGDMFNLVGFQTNLTFMEQRRVFGMIPALKNAEFLRYGVMHRNSFIDAPKTINSFFQTLKYPHTFIAGQLSGVEGYVESIASGFMAATNVARLLENKEMLVLPIETIIGALANYLSIPNENFQPMNANFGLLPQTESKIRDKKARKMLYHDRSIEKLKHFLLVKELIC